MNKALLCIFVLLTMGVSQVKPQEPDSSKSKTAILFNIVDLNLEGYNGGVGFKYWLNKSYAIKAGVDFSYSDNRRNDPYDFDENYSLDKSIGFSIDIERHFYVKDNLQLYCGLGLGPQWSVRRTDTYNNSYSAPNTNGSRTYTTSLKSNLLFGAEYTLNKTFSLSFQQTLSGIYSFGEQESFSSERGTKTELESFNLDLGSTSLTLLIYF